jgi:hypothetical protein
LAAAALARLIFAAAGRPGEASRLYMNEFTRLYLAEGYAMSQ